MPEETETPNRVALNISTIAPERPSVVIDDKAYDLRVRADFGARQWFELERDMRNHDELAQKDDKKVADFAKLEQLTERMVQAVLKVPEEVLKTLSYLQQRDVVMVFQLQLFEAGQLDETEEALTETAS